MGENYSFEITINHGCFVLMELGDNDSIIKKLSLDIFIRELLEKEEIVDAYENGNLSFSNNIDDFTRDEIINALKATIENKKMAVLGEFE